MELKISNNLVYIDDEDVEKIKNLKLRIDKNGGNPICMFYVKRENSNQKPYKYLHHIILGDKPSNYVAYFKDGNRLNLKKENLSYIPRKTFSHIHVPKLGEKDDFRGVVKVFIAKIKHNSKTYHLGTFNTKTEAAKAYDRKAIELYGLEKARVNNF